MNILSTLIKSLPHDNTAFDLIVESPNAWQMISLTFWSNINLLQIVLLATEVVKEGIVGKEGITRLAEVGSHTTLWCFEYFHAQNNTEALKGIAEMMLPFYKDCSGENSSKYKAILNIVNLKLMNSFRWISLELPSEFRLQINLGSSSSPNRAGHSRPEERVRRIDAIDR